MGTQSTIVFCLAVAYCASLGLPPTFKKCNRTQADLNQCLAAALQDALSQLDEPFPDYGLPSLNPLESEHVTMPAGRSVLQLAQKYTRFNIYGLTTANVTTFNWNFDNNTIYIEATFPEVRLAVEYDFDGKVLFIPIRGKGPGSISAIDITFFINFKLEEYDKDGEKYYKVVQTVVTKEPRLIKFNLANATRLDQVLGGLGDVGGRLGGLGRLGNVRRRVTDALDVNGLFNNNWRRIFDDVKVGYLDFQSWKYQEIFNNFLEKVPISELFENE